MNNSSEVGSMETVEFKVTASISHPDYAKQVSAELAEVQYVTSVQTLPDRMETGKADDKVSISQRIVDFLLCQETPPENAKPTPKGSACTSPDKWDALRKAAEAATPGPWRVRKKINNDKRDRTKITDIRWEIGAGTQTEPKQNKGHFHPEDEWYTSDETSVVETSMDRDYNDYEGGIGKQEDATFIALANPAAILELLSELRELQNGR